MNSLERDRGMKNERDLRKEHKKAAVRERMDTD